MKIRSVGAELFHAQGQTDTTKLTVVFRNFANAPKNAYFNIGIVGVKHVKFIFKDSNLKRNDSITNLQYVLKVSKILNETQNSIHETEGTTQENSFHSKLTENTDGSTEYKADIQTLPNLRNSHIPEDLAQVKFCASRN
jgi:hypothetical protein